MGVVELGRSCLLSLGRRSVFQETRFLFQIWFTCEVGGRIGG